MTILVLFFNFFHKKPNLLSTRISVFLRKYYISQDTVGSNHLRQRHNGSQNHTFDTDAKSYNCFLGSHGTFPIR